MTDEASRQCTYVHRQVYIAQDCQKAVRQCPRVGQTQIGVVASRDWSKLTTFSIEATKSSSASTIQIVVRYWKY